MTKKFLALALGALFGGILFVACEKEKTTADTVVEQNDSIPAHNPETMGFDSIGASMACFSVDDFRQVRFSRGNLQYQASTDTWRFAEHQYECIGNANANISAAYNGWIDLFGWGTSGWNSGANAYQPWSSSITASDYYIAGDENNSFTGSYVNADWGVYNAIVQGGNRAGLWRTLTADEWRYIFSQRDNAEQLYGFATIDGKYHGVVILPDNWALPENICFTSGTQGWTINQFSLEQWARMEEAGAIFLPAAGLRNGNFVSKINEEGLYWTSSTYYNFGKNISFRENMINPRNVHERNYGFSVRLVLR